MHLAETNVVSADYYCTEVHVDFERLMDLIMSIILAAILPLLGVPASCDGNCHFGAWAWQESRAGCGSFWCS